ncbi:MAG TPA: crossover junction endodeoxyribonuclease RuvC [Armatimonadetes bacterium]|nr:crossover junction endodeoxyribonuclease RuvC [Armatimonadota bacterium]
MGVDPGLSGTGYGVVALRGAGRLEAVDFGVIRTRKGPEELRLLRIFEALRALIIDRRPEVLAIERVFYHRSFEAASQTGKVAGAAMLAAAACGVPVAQYAPKEVKIAVTGHGGADKKQVAYMVRQILGLDDEPPEHASDALALCICHLHLSSATFNGGLLKGGEGA